ncbi:MAG: NYN domain-containing protein [Bacteroidia bacterium]
MTQSSTSKGLTRIGVFYDGNYFHHVSNYYNYEHARKSRLSIAGLHNFIRHQVAAEEGNSAHHCQIVNAHYFRGRLNARDASQRGNLLYYDRVFDDILMSEGVITHYLPLRGFANRRDDHSIDVWLSLEAYEMAAIKGLEVVVLIGSDGDYVPLVRKLNALGVRVMVLGWDFSFSDDTGRMQVTRTSQDLLKEASYPLEMHKLIDNDEGNENELVKHLFVQPNVGHAKPKNKPTSAERHTSEVLSLKDGYGFIKFPNNNLFFFYGDITEGEFNEFHEGDLVEFSLGKNEQGDDVAREVRKLGEDEIEYVEEEYEVEDEDYGGYDGGSGGDYEDGYVEEQEQVAD